jgi:hypothetical protein
MTEIKDPALLCKHCKADWVMKSPADWPYQDEGWICPSCFSTYQIPAFTPTDPQILEDASNWRKLQKAFSRPDKMRLDIAPVWDSRNVGQ